MCGIAGMIDWRAATSADALRSIGEAMIETVRHRGPDAGAVWVEAESGAALGHRRLAIIDLSPGGAQPMHSADRRYVITFNGEIYNYRDIRRELQAAGHSMRGESDTEVLLEACALWGVEAAIERAIGMFAFALWDRKTRSLTLARDRLGIKPLYYAATPQRVIFASQLKAFRAAPDWRPTIDDDAVVGYLRHAYIAQPRTIYREAEKLAPGHILTLREGTTPLPKCFWDLRAIAVAGQRRNDPAPDANEAIERLDALLRDSVGLRMIADVPLGAFLSGGIDSSTVVALMQAQSSRPVKSFSIGFHESGYDEAQCAKQVAAHLGTDHTEFYVEPRHALEVIPRLADWFDEPFADSSQIPTYLISELTRKHVTVALSGDGGDELFAGYNRYLWAERLARVFKMMPPPLRGARFGGGLAFARATNLEPVVCVRAGVMAAGVARRQAAQNHDTPRQPRAGRNLPPPREPMGTARRGCRRWPRAARTTVGSRHRRRFPRSRPAHAVPRHGELSSRGHSDQGRPGDDGGGAGGPGAVAGSPRRCLLLEPAACVQGARRARQMVAAPGARSLCAEVADRPAEDGFRGADRCLAARSFTGMGGIAARTRAACV